MQDTMSQTDLLLPRHPATIAEGHLPCNAGFLLTCLMRSFFFGLIVTGCLTTTGSGSQGENTSDSNISEWKRPRLIHPKTSLDLGQGPVGQELSGSFVLENGGQENLRIENVEVGCACSSFELTKHVLAFGESAKLTVITQLREPGKKLVFPIRIFSNDPHLPVALCMVKAEPQPEFARTDPSELDFGEVLEGTSPPRTITVTKRDGSPWSAAHQPRAFSANEHLFIDRLGDSHPNPNAAKTFAIKLDSNLSAGSFSDTITFSDPENQHQIRVPVRASIVPAIQVRPNLLWFNDLSTESGPLERTVLVRRNDGKSLGGIVKTAAAIPGVRLSDVHSQCQLRTNILKLTVILDPVMAQGFERGQLLFWLKDEPNPLTVRILVNWAEGMKHSTNPALKF